MRALVLSGGGSKGAFQAGVIRSLTDKGRTWDTIAGVSVGALNGSFLAQFPKKDQIAGSQFLLKFWLEVRGDKSVFKRWFPFGRLHGLWKGGLYNTKPLEELVRKNVDPGLLQASGVKLLMGAVNLESGEYRYVRGTDSNIHDWILASSAFPAAFPPRKIDGGNWVDGGVRDITPITDVLDENPDEIDVILTGNPANGGGTAPAKDAKNVLKVAMRSAMLMSDEIFCSDMDRVPEKDLPRIKVYCPDADFQMADPLTFDPDHIHRMLTHGLTVGDR